MDWMDGYIKLWNGKLHLCVNKLSSSQMNFAPLFDLSGFRRS